MGNSFLGRGFESQTGVMNISQRERWFSLMEVFISRCVAWRKSEQERGARR